MSIQEITDIFDLCNALNECDGDVDFDNLPVFGHPDNEPADMDGIISWDNMFVILEEGNYFVVRHRDEVCDFPVKDGEPLYHKLDYMGGKKYGFFS